MERFIIKPSWEKGSWVATDTLHGVSVKFKEHKFNDTQEVFLAEGKHFDNVEDALKVATYMREIADWLNANHSDKVF